MEGSKSKAQQGAVLICFFTAYLHGEEQASPAFEYCVSLLCHCPTIIFLSACSCVYIYMYLFFTPEDSSCLAFKFSGLFWSAVEGQTQVKVRLLLTWLCLAQSMGWVCVLLLPEEGRGPAHLVILKPLLGTLWLDPLIEKIKSRQLVYRKLFYVFMAASVCCKCRCHPSLFMSALFFSFNISVGCPDWKPHCSAFCSHSPVCNF